MWLSCLPPSDGIGFHQAGMIPDIGIALAKNFVPDRSVSGNAFIVRLLSYVKGALLRFKSRTGHLFIRLSY